MDGVCSFLIVKLEGAGDRLSLAPCMRCRRPLENVAADNLAMSNVSLPVPSGSRPHCKLIMAGYHAAADADSHKKLAQRAAAVFKSNFGEYQTVCQPSLMASVTVRSAGGCLRAAQALD